LTLPISDSAAFVSADVTVATTLAHTNVAFISQLAKTGVQKINPYLSFTILPARITLIPAVDRHITVITDVVSRITRKFYRWSPRWKGGKLGDTRIVVEKSTTLVSKSIKKDANLRQIPVSFTVTGFGSGEAISSVKIDGVTVTAT